MKYFAIFWLLLLGALIFIIFNYKKIKAGKYQNGFTVIWIVGTVLILMAILTNDPFFQFIGLPKEYEWLAGLLTSAFTGWLTYLRPLKNKVNDMNREVGEIKTNVQNINKSMDEFRPYILKKK